MERFTKKRDSSGLYITIDDELVCSDYGISYEKAVDKKVLQACDKLGKLEDLEEELGCPIEVLHEALKNGIYSILRGTDKIFDNTVITDGKYLYAIPLDIYDEQWLIKDYKKTWWLRKDKSE